VGQMDVIQRHDKTDAGDEFFEYTCIGLLGLNRLVLIHRPLSMDEPEKFWFVCLYKPAPSADNMVLGRFETPANGDMAVLAIFKTLAAFNQEAEEAAIINAVELKQPLTPGKIIVFPGRKDN